MGSEMCIRDSRQEDGRGHERNEDHVHEQLPASVGAKADLEEDQVELVALDQLFRRRQGGGSKGLPKIKASSNCGPLRLTTTNYYK